MNSSLPAKGKASTARTDFFGVCMFAVLVFSFAATVELNERVVLWLRPFEHLQLDEIPFALLAMSIGLTWFSRRRWNEAKQEILQRQLVEQALERSRAELRELSHQSMQQLENERRSLSRELHDEMGQSLNAIKIEAVTIRNAASTEAPAAEIKRAAQAIIGLTDMVYGVVRQINGRLRPVALDELGLAAALENCVDGWRERLPATRFEFSYSGELDQLDEARSIALYRVVQECLTNAVRHGGASRVAVDLQAVQHPSGVRLEVSDDGTGVDLGVVTQGFGLIGIRERVESVSGIVEFFARPGGGFRVSVFLPVQFEESGL